MRPAGALPVRRPGPHEAERRIGKYLSRRALRGPWTLAGDAGFSPELAIVIPVLAEEAWLYDTLRSLTASPPADLDRTLVVVVVNNPDPQHARDAYRENQRTLQRLRTGLRDSAAPGAPEGLGALRLSWIDASSPPYALAGPDAGVGLARKIGLDLALARMAPAAGAHRGLACLDADTRARPGYIRALLELFRHGAPGGVAIDFDHPAGKADTRAVAACEIILRHRVLGLRYACSPYAFHTIGSAMAVRADAYAAAGGMNRRRTTEDFYFLQQVAKCDGVRTFGGAGVRPSPRLSNRVPVIGTGRRMARLVAGGTAARELPRAEIFHRLKRWLELLHDSPDNGPDETRARLRRDDPLIARFLDREGFRETWLRIAKNAPDHATVRTQLHRWFDGLKTLRLIHVLQGSGVASLPPGPAARDMLALHGVAGGVSDETALETLLERLRDLDRATAAAPRCPPSEARV